MVFVGFDLFGRFLKSFLCVFSLAVVVVSVGVSISAIGCLVRPLSESDMTIGVARIYSGGGVTFLDQKSDDLFLVVTLSYIVICVIYCQQLPLISHLRGCTSPSTAPFLPYFNKNA